MYKTTELLKVIHFFVLQLLEQDRHLLRRKLESTQSECDTRLLELQADIRELNRTLVERETTLKQTEREKAILISELTEQNQRLTNSLKEVRVLEFTLSEISFQTDSLQLRPQYLSN
jgi:septal ring factor EnvC (AmiA/AmiB activator)